MRDEYNPKIFFSNPPSGDNTRFDVILLDDDLFKDDDEKGAELKSSFIIQGSNLGGGEQQGSRVIEENLSKNALTVQCDLAQIIHGTMSEGGTPATLIVFKFKFIPRDNRRRFKNAEITIEFSAGEVFNITPNGTWMTLQSETQQELSHSVDPSLEAGFGPATATLGYTWQLKKNTTVEGHCTVVGYTMALKQTRSMTKARQNTIFWVLRENPQTKSGIPSFMQAAALLKRERTGEEPMGPKFSAEITIRGEVDNHKWVTDKLEGLKNMTGKNRKGEDIFFNPKKNRGAVDDANNLRNVKLDTYKKLVAIRPWVDGNGNVEDQVLVPPEVIQDGSVDMSQPQASVKPVAVSTILGDVAASPSMEDTAKRINPYLAASDSGEELSRLQTEMATLSHSVEDTSKDINQYLAVSDSGEELSRLQTEIATISLSVEDTSKDINQYLTVSDSSEKLFKLQTEMATLSHSVEDTSKDINQYLTVSDSSEELSRLQAETATFSLSVGDTSKDINRYPAVSDTGEELSGLQTEAAAFTLANPTSTGLTFEDDAGKDRIVSLSVEEKQRILEDLKQDLLLVRNETRLVTQLVILGRDERRLLKESRKLRGFP